ncbi:MAG: CotH kinase family protein, partial [Bacteroidota bacterium]|nr:CotH kinase family protein [Bacteroidota bacterium]
MMRSFLFRFCLALSLLSNAEISYSQNEGDSIFNAPSIHDVYMTFSQTSYWDSLTAYYITDEYLKGDISFDGITYLNVGIKFKGNSSYSNPSDKKSFKVDMNEYVSGQDLNGLKKFNLNNCFKDPSFLREKLTLDFCRDHSIAAPRCAYSRVFINGTYWGLYTFVEEADNGTFLNQRFDNKQGNMFKGDPTGDLKWLGSSASSYFGKYELKTNETANDWSDLVNLLDNINNSGTAFYDSLEASFNTTTFIKNWAVDNLFVNLDSYIGSGHNFFIYHDTLSNKFEWVTWDVNEAFGNFKMGLTTTQVQNLSLFHVSTPSANRPLVQKMLLNSTYKNALANTVCEWLQYDFSNTNLDAKIDSLANAIRVD